MGPLDNAVTEFISININFSFCQEGPQCPVICVWLDISPDGGLGQLPDPVQPAVRHLTGVSHQVGRHEISVRPNKGRAGHPGPHFTEGSLVSNHYNKYKSRELIISILVM